MRAAIAIAAIFGAVGTAAAQPAVTKPRAELIEQGFKVVAEGALTEAVECREWESRMHVVGWKEPPPLYSNLCLGAAKYGSFQRLKSDDGEFVCVSFRDWTCYPSPAQN